MHQNLRKRDASSILTRAAIVFSLAALYLALIWTNGNVSDAANVPNKESTDDNWIYSHTASDVMIFRKAETVSGHACFRGVTTADFHISKILGPFSNVSLAPDWITMLKTMIAIQDKSVHADLVYQLFNLPWPVQDRDLVMRRDWTFDKKTRSVRVLYTSIVDERFPPVDGVVRAHTSHTQWHFTVVPGNRHRTIVELESILDSKGNLPVLLTNFIQSQCPHKIVSGLVKMAAINASGPLSSIIDW